MLDNLPKSAADPALLVGFETGDDAAVYRINDEQAVVATTDFFMPIVDDPYDYGRIAATNALSDVYAVGGKPILALAIAGFPVNDMTTEQIQSVLQGGTQACLDAGVPVGGGHTIDAPEPIYGLAVVGLVHPDRIKRNSDAVAGDVLVLGKGLGVGILGAAMNKDELDPEGYEEMVESATKLNSIGADLAGMEGVNAVTDVTGFGLLGHLFELCEGAGLAAKSGVGQAPHPAGGARLCPEGLQHGRGQPQLGELRRSCIGPREPGRMAAQHADGPADLRRPDGLVPARPGGRRGQAVPRAGLRPRRGYR